jgi:hypothetical protein
MRPEQVCGAARDVRAAVMLPVRWGAFGLHPGIGREARHRGRQLGRIDNDARLERAVTLGTALPFTVGVKLAWTGVRALSTVHQRADSQSLPPPYANPPQQALQVLTQFTDERHSRLCAPVPDGVPRRPARSTRACSCVTNSSAPPPATPNSKSRKPTGRRSEGQVPETALHQLRQGVTDKGGLTAGETLEL